MSDVLTRRLGYFLSPQLDLYVYAARYVGGKKRILDAGCGTGFGTLQFTGADDNDVIGIDLDRGLVTFANSYIPGVRFYCDDILQFGGMGTFDTVLLIEVLEHIPDWKAALRNVAKILKPGGELIMSARNANADLRKNDLHEREWSAQQVLDALKPFFANVELYDYTLSEKQTVDTRITPVIAVATKERG